MSSRSLRSRFNAIVHIQSRSQRASHALSQSLKKRSLHILSDEEPRLLKLSLDFFAEHSHFSFGSSSGCNIVLPEEADVSPEHLKLHFEMHTGLVLVTDESNSGTWIMDDVLNPEGIALERATQTLSQKTTIVIGTKSDICFSIRIVTQETISFESRFVDYTTSVGFPKPRTILGPAASNARYLSPEQTWICLDQLQRGGFGTISACLNTSSGALYAAKACRDSSKPSHLASLKREISLLKTLRHPNIVRFVAQVEQVLLIEFVAGGSLAHLLNDASPMDLSSVHAVIRQSLRAVAFVHGRGIIHNDIKPDNILIHNRQPLRIKLCDFGAAYDTKLPSSRHTKIGTRLYMSPEFGSEQHSFGVDIWALGLVIMNCSGFWPWNSTMVKGRSVRSLNRSDLSHASLLHGMLEPDAAKRFNAQECLEHALLGQGQDVDRTWPIYDTSLQQPSGKRQKLERDISSQSSTAKPLDIRVPQADIQDEVVHSATETKRPSLWLLHKASRIAERMLGLGGTGEP